MNAVNLILAATLWCLGPKNLPNQDYTKSELEACQQRFVEIAKEKESKIDEILHGFTLLK